MLSLPDRLRRSKWYGDCGEQHDDRAGGPQLRWANNPRETIQASSETLHLALPPIASCIPGEGQIGPRKAGSSSPPTIPHLIRFATQVIAGKALVEFSTAAAPC